MTAPLLIDLFAGGGGASQGIYEALGWHPTVAVNHNAHAISMHEANHPSTIHLQTNVHDVDPVATCGGRSPLLLWASPDCTHFSRAKGSVPRSKEIRSLAWVVVDWARAVRPTVIALENVPEFEGWGPLDDEGRPDRARAGETFRAFVEALRGLGYAVDWRVLRACDFGAPTTRRRLFLVARCDGEAVRWPEPTHGPGCAAPWRTAAEVIDWALPIPSIFERRRPLAEATHRRIAAGLRRYVFENAAPFLLTLTHGGRLHPLGAPVPTVTAAHRGELALVAPTLVQTGYGEREGQAPRSLDLRAPLGTVVAGGAKHALVGAWLTKFYGTSQAAPVDAPAPTVTAGGGHVAVGAAWLAKHYGGVVGHDVERPLGTVTGRDHHALCVAFITKYYGQGSQAQGAGAPLDTVVSKARFGLVMVELDGEPWALVDIGMRMLEPHELAAAQGFGPDYVLTGTKSQRIERIGNSVCPQVARAIVEANLGRHARCVAA